MSKFRLRLPRIKFWVRLVIFTITAIIIYAPREVVLVAIGIPIYFMAAQVFALPGFRLLRRIWYPYILSIIEDTLTKKEEYSLVAYPALLNIEFNEEHYKRKYIIFGVGEKFFGYVAETALSGPRWNPEEQADIDETEELQRQAQELQHISDESTFHALMWNPQAKAWRRENYQHKSSNKRRKHSQYYTEEQIKAFEEEKRERMKRDLAIFGNEAGKEVLARMNYEDELKDVLKENKIAPPDDAEGKEEGK